MDLNEILNLNNDLENLNLIKDFFAHSRSVFEYEEALLKYLEISNYNKSYNLSLKEGERLLFNILDDKPTSKRVDIYKELFLACINLNRFNDALKYLNLRKELLPEMQMYLSLIDEYNLLIKQNKDAEDVLVTLNKEITPEDIKIDTKEKLVELYIEKKKYIEAKDLLEQLFDETYNYKYNNKLVYVKYLNEEYDQVIKDALTMEEDNTSDVGTIAYLISSLIKNEHYEFASRLESKYENTFKNSSDDDIKRFIFNEFIVLYKQLNHSISVDMYRKLLKEIKPKKVKQEESVKVQEVIKIKEIKTETVIRSAKYIEHFNWINEWLLFSKTIEENIQFREYLRTLFIEIEEKIKFNEVVVYYNKNNYDSNLFNYKNKKLYDKRIINETLNNTLINESLKNKRDYYQPTSSLINNKDILTEKRLKQEVKFIYSFYLDDNLAMNFYMSEDISDPALYYELLLGITTIIKLKLLDDNAKKRLINESKQLSHIINNKIMPVRVLTHSRNTYNEVASSLLNIDKNYHIEMFYRELLIEDHKRLEDAIKRILTYPNETKTITYNYKTKTIKEYLFGYNIDDINYVISFLVDITHGVKTENELIEEAIIDKETSLYNKHKFRTDFDNLIKGKRTFLLVELNNKNSLVFGHEKSNNYFIEFARYTKKHYGDNVYRISFNQLIITLDINDVRAVKNNVMEYLTVIDHLESVVLPHEKFKVHIASLRYPVVTEDKKIDNIFKYLDTTLLYAMHRNLNYVDFTFPIYEKEIYEQEIIDYLNTAIDNKQMSIHFKQIINIKDNVVANYESELYLNNLDIDPNYLKKLAEKRNKLIEFEYFHIEYVASFLRKLKDKTNYFIKISIPISEETFLSNNFESHIISTLKAYDISFDYITLLLDAKLNTQNKIIKAHKLNKLGITLETTDIDTLLNESFNALHLNYNNISRKWRFYIQNLNIILDELKSRLVIRNVNKKEERELLKRLNIKFIEGNIYSKIKAEQLITQIKENFND